MPSKLPITVGFHIPMSNKRAATGGESWESGSSCLGLVKSLSHRSDLGTLSLKRKWLNSNLVIVS